MTVSRCSWWVACCSPRVLGAWLVRGAARGGFADTLSTWRAQPDGARGLFLLAQESGLPVVRRTADLHILQKDTGSPVLLAVEVEDAREDDPDQTALAAGREDGLEDEDVPRHGFNRLHVPELSEKETEKLLEHVKAGHTLVYVPWGSQGEPAAGRARGEALQGGHLAAHAHARPAAAPARTRWAWSAWRRRCRPT